MTDRYAIDSHKLIYHPQRVSQWLAAKDDWAAAKNVYPIYVEISPVGACNHRCTFCAVDYIGYQSRRLDATIMAGRLLEMGRLGVKSVMFAGEGEPLLHKQLPVMIEACAEAGIDVSITTNATVVSENFLQRALPHIAWIKASVNAGSAETYAKVHQTKASDFELALGNLRRIVEARDARGLKLVVGAQAVLLPENRHEMVDLARRCRDELGLDYLVVKPYSQHLASHTTQYQDIDYSEFMTLEAQLRAENSENFQVVFRGNTMRKTMRKHSDIGEQPARYSRCSATPFFWAYVMADGDVYGCSAYLLDKKFQYGNLHETSFQEIWQSEARKTNFEFVNHGLDISDCRANCRMDDINRYLDALRSGGVPHVNFI